MRRKDYLADWAGLPWGEDNSSQAGEMSIKAGAAVYRQSKLHLQNLSSSFIANLLQ